MVYGVVIYGQIMIMMYGTVDCVLSHIFDMIGYRFSVDETKSINVELNWLDNSDGNIGILICNGMIVRYSIVC